MIYIFSYPFFHCFLSTRKSQKSAISHRKLNSVVISRMLPTTNKARLQPHPIPWSAAPVCRIHCPLPPNIALSPRQINSQLVYHGGIPIRRTFHKWVSRERWDMQANSHISIVEMIFAFLLFKSLNLNIYGLI